MTLDILTDCKTLLQIEPINILYIHDHMQIDVNKARTDNGKTALIAATMKGNFAIVELLLGHAGIDPNQE